jgi:hypothetical protein
MRAEDVRAALPIVLERTPVTPAEGAAPPEDPDPEPPAVVVPVVGGVDAAGL